MNKWIFNKYLQPGFAMAIALVSLSVFSLLLAIIFHQIVMHNREVIKYQVRAKLKYLAEGSLYRALYQIRQSGYENIETEIFDIIPDTCQVEIKRQGLFLHLKSTATIDKHSLTLSSTIGYNAHVLFPPAMSVCGPVDVFVFSRNVFIEGDIVLRADDIHYAPPELEKVKIVNGKITLDIDQNLIPINVTYIDSIFKNSIEEINNYVPSEYIILNRKTYHANDLQNSKTFLENDCIISSDEDREEIEGPCKILSKGNLTFTGGANYKGCWEIVTSGDVFIKDNVHFENVSIYSQSGIYFESNSSARGLFISAKQIVVTNSARLEFPSYIIAPQNDIKPPIEPEIAILHNADFSGAIILYEQTKDKTQNQHHRKYGKVMINTAIPIKGGVYSAGTIELYGKVMGFISGATIEQQIKETRWINYLENVQIDRYASTLNLPLPLCFSATDYLDLLEISETKNEKTD